VIAADTIAPVRDDRLYRRVLAACAEHLGIEDPRDLRRLDVGLPHGLALHRVDPQSAVFAVVYWMGALGKIVRKDNPTTRRVEA
jgi:hypothetical protein